MNPNITLKIVIITREENKRREKNLQNNPKTMNQIAVRTYISIITLNVNGLYAPIKRHRVAK